jgi:hypothetical protein
MSVHVIKPSPHQGQVVDDAILAYVEWREECTEVWNTCARWVGAPAEDARRPYPAYRAAIDREESAAKGYEMQINRVRNLVEAGWHYPVRPEVRSGRRT